LQHADSIIVQRPIFGASAMFHDTVALTLTLAAVSEDYNTVSLSEISTTGETQFTVLTANSLFICLCHF